MDRVNGFVQVWHTSSCSADENNGVFEGHVTTSSDVTFTLDFPIPRESYVNTPSAANNFSIRKRESSKVFDSSFPPVLSYNEFSTNQTTPEMKRAVVGLTSRTTAKIAEAIEEYSDISTFHGMRFVCAKKFHRLRRVIWVLMVIGCLFALGWQVYKQVFYFYSNPKSVSVEKKHTGYVEFPSLTICNENSFKITAAVEAGMYEIVNQMMAGSLTLALLKKTGMTNMRLDELNYRLGNQKETMLLRCKWGEDECGIDNFTTIITDQGLCFTFNGPGTIRDLKVQTPGSSKGLQLTLNVEEYERMAGPHVASGIHMLVHMKQEYPLVEQFGQAVAAGSHTFVALSLRKEHRLSYPYDTCMVGQLTYVPNITYGYDLAACQTDCFVKYVVERCGCKDYHMPGDIAVCTLAEYLACLRPAQKDYPIKAEQDCKCTIPCNSELAETTYSYAALSRSAINKIDQEDIDNILPRYRKAIDVYEYMNKRNQYKKETYRAFSKTLGTVRDLYESVTFTLKVVKSEILNLQEFMASLYGIRDDYILAQIYVVQKFFVGAKNEMDETTLGELADDMYVFSHNIERKILDISTSKEKTIRDVQYTLLREMLLGRIWLANLALENLTKLMAAYETGTPLLNYSLPIDRDLEISFDIETIIPRELLKRALNQKEDGKMIALSAHIYITHISKLLSSILNISTTVYEAGSITQEQETYIRDSVEMFKDNCTKYLIVREQLYKEIIEWPISELTKTAIMVKEANGKCEDVFSNMLSKLDRLLEIVSDTPLSVFIHADDLLQAYVYTWNVTKFDIADLFLNNVSSLARTNFETSRQNIETYVEDINGLWSSLDTCVAEMIQEISEDESLKKMCETSLNAMFLGDFETLRLRKNITEQIRLQFNGIQALQQKHHELHMVTSSVVDDLKIFNDSAIMDASFYSKNIIFLDVFFTDISYTVTEHQVAYDVFKLLSDIGGSMGLLVGASAISLFEFLDLFCVIAAHICKGSRRMGERFRSKTPVTNIYCQR